MMQKSKSAHRMQCKQVNMQSNKTPNDKHTSARIDLLSPDQQQVKTSPAESPADATAKINRVATNIFILKRKGMPANHKTKRRSHDQRKRVRESVTRGEGASTPRAHRIQWYPRMCLKLWVCNKSRLIWTKMHAKCREKKGMCSHVKDRKTLRKGGFE